MYASNKVSSQSLSGQNQQHLKRILTQKRRCTHYQVYYGKDVKDVICTSSGGFRVGGAEARLKRGPSDDVIVLSQP